MTRPLPKSLLALVAGRPEFHEGHTERDSWAKEGAWSHWIYLAPGYCYPELGSHIIHEPTVREARAAWKEVRPCDCDDCKAELARA